MGLLYSVLLSFLFVIMAANDATCGIKALLFANENYVGGGLPPLPGVIDETKALADRLRLMNVKVWKDRTFSDLGTVEMQNEIKSFTSQLAIGDIAIVYYGGHGIQSDGVNFLMPVHADIALPGAALQMDADLLRPLARSAAGARIVFLDACRTLPESPAVGLAQPEMAPLESLIVFATAPNMTASNPSPFTKALIGRIAEPGTSLREIVEKVRADVLKETNNLQRPQEFGTLTKPVVLRPPTTVELQALSVDDIMTVYVNGAPSVSWDRNQPGKITLPLIVGTNDFRIDIHNQRTFTGGIKELGGHQPEGWSYELIVRSAGQDIVHLKDGENRPREDGPQHGRTFVAAQFILTVDSVSATVSVHNLNKDVWKR